MSHSKLSARIGDWFLLSRAPFLPAGILPFVAGSLLAARFGYPFHAAVFWWAALAVTLIMVATNLNGEAYDRVEDSIGAAFGKSIFAGGSGVVVEGRVSPVLVARVSWRIFAAALCIGIILQFVYRTGALTLLLGMTGALAGFFYSKPPFRWAKRGFGEVLIAYSYGWLPVAMGFYLQTGYFVPKINLIALPVAFSIFNVVFINEFLDYQADKLAGKRNLLVRIGKPRGAYVYAAAALGGVFFLLISFSFGLPQAGLWVALPAAILSCIAAFFVLRGEYENRNRLELVCGLTVVVNLLFSLAYIAAFFK